ncbi:hypothetical protein Zmor_001822 [Zophobas morio]|uniref:Uncharacterized protein n=1 Tax=Zophobas morio TaxID=2755281 RepID=A0AA38J3A7_9CUCU|nr:hypothetical protein Zmor_001822 [Zophobas morio]
MSVTSHSFFPKPLLHMLSIFLFINGNSSNTKIKIILLRTQWETRSAATVFPRIRHPAEGIHLANEAIFHSEVGRFCFEEQAEIWGFTAPIWGTGSGLPIQFLLSNSRKVASILGRAGQSSRFAYNTEDNIADSPIRCALGHFAEWEP